MLIVETLEMRLSDGARRQASRQSLDKCDKIAWGFHHRYLLGYCSHPYSFGILAREVAKEETVTSQT